MIVGTSVTMATPFRGEPEEFSNTANYNLPDNFAVDEFADALVDVYRTEIYSSGVEFRRVQIWGPDDEGPIVNDMLWDETLSGAGETSYPGQSLVEIYPELCVVANILTPRKDSRGNPIFHRKYYHTAIVSGGQSTALGDTVIPIDLRTTIRLGTQSLLRIGSGENTAPMCNRGGAEVPATAPIDVVPYLHIRQFNQ